MMLQLCKWLPFFLILALWCPECLCQSPPFGIEDSKLPGFDGLRNAIKFVEQNAPVKKQGYLSWKYRQLLRGEILATPIAQGNDNLDILSVWENNEPVITLISANSDFYYDRIQLDSVVSLGWNVQILFSEDSIPRVSQLFLGSKDANYEIFRNETGYLYFKSQFNDSLFAYVGLSSSGNPDGDLYVWNSVVEDYVYYFPFKHSIGDIEQVFVKDGDDWLELVFSLSDRRIEAIARHDSVPYNMKEILIRDDRISPSVSLLEFRSEGNVFSKVDATDLFTGHEALDRIRRDVVGFIDHIARSHLQITREFDFVTILEMKPMEVLKLSNH